jgi:hypothetical protein
MGSTDETVLQNVRRHADEIRVRIHLAGMEARDAWAALEPKVTRLEHMFEHVTFDAGDDVNEFAAIVQKELEKLRRRVFENTGRAT